MKKYWLHYVITAVMALGITSCSDDDAGEPISNTESTFDIISASPDHTILEDLLVENGLDETLDSGTFTVFAPTDDAFNSVNISSLSSEDVIQILTYHVIEGAAESTDLQTQYINTLASENITSESNSLSLHVNFGAEIILNGSARVIDPNLLGSNGVVHVIDEVLTIPNVTTFVESDANFETLAAALTREDQPDFLSILSTDEEPGPFTVFAPTNEAFSSLFLTLEIDDLMDIEAGVLTSVLNTHVISGNNFTASNLPSGTIETLGETFELNGTTITDQNGRMIEIVVTDVQAANGIIHVVDAVILPELELGPPPSANTVSMTVDNDGAAAYFVSEINGDENVTELNSNNSSWTLTTGTRYVLTVTGASSHPFELRDSSDNALLSQNGEGSFEGDAGVDFISSGTQFEFTLTPELAAEIDRYFCTIHSGMNGEIVVNQ